MFHDTTLHTNAVKQEREARCLMVSLEKQVRKMEIIKDKEFKSQLLQYYKDKYDITVSERQIFFLTSEKLKELLIKKSRQVVMNQAATKI